MFARCRMLADGAWPSVRPIITEGLDLHSEPISSVRGDRPDLPSWGKTLMRPTRIINRRGIDTLSSCSKVGDHRRFQTVPHSDYERTAS